MATLAYNAPEDRAERLVAKLTEAGYHGALGRRRFLSPVQTVEIQDVDDRQRDEVRSLVRELEPLAAPVLVPLQR